MLTLYFAPGTSSMAPHIALHEIGVPFTAKPLSFARQEQRAPEFLRINPEGRVPTLLIDGRALTEVAAILYYLGRKFPRAKLWPEGDLDAEAQAISWMSFIASTLHPARARGLDHVFTAYALADRRLGRADWVLEQYSVADIHLFRLYWRIRSALPSQAGFAALEAHYQRMMARPAVQKTLNIESSVGYELPA